jgi:hypothetical protein
VNTIMNLGILYISRLAECTISFSWKDSALWSLLVGAFWTEHVERENLATNGKLLRLNSRALMP